MSRRCFKSGLVAVPVSDWPRPDRLAWEAAVRDGNVLDDVGAAAHWSPKYRRAAMTYFGQWISWRALQGIAAQEASADWAKPKIFEPLVAHLQPRVAPETVASLFRHLNAMLRVMYPDLNRRALQHGVACLENEANPSRDKASRIRHSWELQE